MRAKVAVAVVLAVGLSPRPSTAAEAVWTVSVVGGREISLPVAQIAGTIPLVDLRLLAADLGLSIVQRDDRAVIRDPTGADWHVTNGSVLLEGPHLTRTLARPAIIAGGAIQLPLDAVAELAGRRLALEPGRAFLLPAATTSPATTPSGDVRAPAGWQPVQIAKTAAELAEMRRLDGDSPTAEEHPVAVREVQPPAHELMTFDVGLGVAQGLSGASDIVAYGSIAGIHVGMNSFWTYGRDGAMYRSGRLTLENSERSWLLEAGDLLSDVRGLARGVRAGWLVGSRWRPSVGMYVRSAALSPVDGSVVAYRDELQLPGDFVMRTEALSDRSGLVGLRWIGGRTSVDTFYRRSSTRATDERGATASYNVWNGVTVQAGARFSDGLKTERWYFAGLSVPVANWATVMLERTRRMPESADTSAVGLQLPIGRVRVMQRYQWTDVAWAPEPVLTTPGYRQMQSLASYSPVPRIQFSYQLATQWSASTVARQWTELQTVFTLSRSTAFHVVTGFPDIGDPQRFRFGLRQELGRKFRLAVDYGRLPAFQSSMDITPQPEEPRFVVMVRRTFTQRTPAAGTDVRGRVVDDRGEPIAGAPVTLGPYVTTSGVDGSYRFAHVPAGDLDLQLDKAHLPAQYASDAAPQSVHVADREPVQFDLRAIPLHAIHGHVYVDRNGNGEFDDGEGIPNVVIRLDDNGTATMSGSDGAYGFYNLVPARYRVWIDESRLSRDVATVSATSLEIELEGDGRSRTGADFRVAPKRKPIMMQPPQQ
jgi:hypothetical protein